MTRHLVLSFRFLVPWFHGRGDEGVPEWPPSPLRAFQAVVAAAARAGMLTKTRPGLTWLEQQAPPKILAPDAALARSGYRLSVPHNAMDLVGRQWSKGGEGDAAEHRTMKNVRPHRLPDEAVVHYVWTIDAAATVDPSLFASVRGVVALGWGADLVVGDGAVMDGAQVGALADGLATWVPHADGRKALRVPREGSLAGLDVRHAAFEARTRLDDPTLRPPPPLKEFAIVSYARGGEPAAPGYAAFTLMRVDADEFRAFEPARQGMVVAGMLRHAVRVAAERAGWDEGRVRGSVLGHGAATAPRLLLVPVPSVEPRGAGAEVVGAIRRVMLFSTDPASRDVAWARRAVGGVDLVDERSGEARAVLATAAPGDRVIARYVAESTTWATVTPVVLPGHDDPGGLRQKLRTVSAGDEQRELILRMHRRREALVRKALLHAGFSDEIAFSAQIETQDVGFLAGVDLASRYAAPSHLRGAPRLHVRLRWPHMVPGPICLGSGRFSGMGLFVGCPD